MISVLSMMMMKMTADTVVKETYNVSLFLFRIIRFACFCFLGSVKKRFCSLRLLLKKYGRPISKVITTFKNAVIGIFESLVASFFL